MTPCDYVRTAGSIVYPEVYGSLEATVCGRPAVCFYVVHGPEDPVFMTGRIVRTLVCRCADHAMPGPGRWMTEEEASVVMVHDS